MLYIALNNLFLNVIAYHIKMNTNSLRNGFNDLNVLSSWIKSYLFGSSLSNNKKVSDSVCLALAKLISVIVLKTSTIASLDLLLNYSQIKSILTNHGMDFELENLSLIHSINLEGIIHKYPLDLSLMKSTYIRCYLNCESEVSKILSENKEKLSSMVGFIRDQVKNI